MNCFVRKAVSKSTGKPYFCLVVKYNEGQKEKFFFGKAYDFFLKANAQLQSMGIYPLPLPDSLRSYQNTLDFDE